MMHKWLEDWHDTLVYLGAVFVLLGFFLSYWKGEYQNRYTEVILQDFLSSAVTSGKITLESYESLIRKVKNINLMYDVDVCVVEYVQKPVYALIPKEQLAEYYVGRNKRKEVEFCSYQPDVVEENPEFLCLQNETNAQLFSSVRNKLPLPEENSVWKTEALEPVQNVYEGEPLLTICRVISEEGAYYAEAQPMNAETSGMVYLELKLEGRNYQVPVQVYCYPRIVVCENGHEVVNSEEHLTERRTISSGQCPYCAAIPAYIFCNKELLRKETGVTLTGQDIGIAVVYMNGMQQYIYPDSEEWQDSYDANFCGIQQVTVRYRGKEDTFLVISENEACQNCGGECNERNYQDYSKLPYCLTCLSDMELFSGIVYEEYSSSSEEIWIHLDENMEKNLKIGEFVQVILLKGSRCVSILQEMVKQDGKPEDN